MIGSARPSNGTVEWFDDKLGSGLVRTADGQLVAVHYKDVASGGHRSLKQGDEIRFLLSEGPEGLRVSAAESGAGFRPAAHASSALARSFVEFCLKRGCVRYMWTNRNGVLSVNMVRYYLVKTRLFEVYLHQFIDDDDNVLHDHPWSFLTVMLAGGYIEELEDGSTRTRLPGSIGYRRAGHTHRVMLPQERRGGVWTLVLTGRRKWRWTFLDRIRSARLTPLEYASRRGAEMRIDSDFRIRGVFFPVLERGTTRPRLIKRERAGD